MGCVLGTFSFNLTAYVRVYRTLLVMFADLVQRALTDDLSQFGRPEGEGSHEQWFVLYDRLSDYLEAYDQRANPIGLFRHESKGKLLLPPSAPDPPPGSRILQHTKVVRTCAVLAGASIGRATDVEGASLVKVSTMNPLIERGAWRFAHPHPLHARRAV